VAETVEIAITC